jgi:hypothetical protein
MGTPILVIVQDLDRRGAQAFPFEADAVFVDPDAVEAGQRAFQGIEAIASLKGK